MRGWWRVEQWWERQRDRMQTVAAVRAVKRFPRISVRRPHGLAAPLVVTLTSYPPRFPTLAWTLRSLLDQSVAADHTVLWIAHADLPLLPPEVLSLTDHGLQIRGCDDLRSYKKLIPALAAFPDNFLVTADDDVYYPPEWLGSLTSDVRPDRREVIAGRAHLASLDPEGHAFPYADWEHATSTRHATSPATRLFPTGVGGILYPPGCFVPEVSDQTTFLRLCPYGDDIWFFWMARLGGIDQTQAARRFRILSWPGSQDVALYHENMLSTRNDTQIQAMEAAFGPMP